MVDLFGTDKDLFLFFMKRSVVHGRTFVASHTCAFVMLCCVSLLLLSLKAGAQDTLYRKDTTPVHKLPPSYQTNILSPNEIKKRTRTMAVIQVGGYSTAMIGLYNAWYKDYPQSSFHFFNDFGEWKGIDKIGHVYSAYAESKASMELWRWTGVDRKKRIWYGGISGFAYQSIIEILDGFSKEWGFSLGDMGANIAGSALVIGQELAWDEQRIQMKWSFHRKFYSDPALVARSNALFGKSDPARFLKDYNGQTYWLSTNLKAFFPRAKLPAWLQLSIGTGAEGMFGGYENIATDKMGNITFDRRDIKRYRQWYLAPDVDLTKIKTNKKGVKILLGILNIWKFPSPVLEYGNGKFKAKFLYF